MLSVDPNLSRAQIAQTLSNTGNQALCPNPNTGQYVSCDRSLADAAAAVAQVAGGDVPENPAPENPAPENPEGALSCGIVVNGTADQALTVPLVIDTNTELRLELTWNNAADLDLYLQDATGQEVLAYSEDVDTTIESIEGEIDADTYLVTVNPYQGSANFQLSVDCNGQGFGDDDDDDDDRGRWAQGTPPGCSVASDDANSPLATLALLLLAAVGIRRRSGRSC